MTPAETPEGQPSAPPTRWAVRLHGKLIDAVYFAAGCDAEYVHSSLVTHDNYPPQIDVRAERMPR